MAEPGARHWGLGKAGFRTKCKQRCKKAAWRHLRSYAREPLGNWRLACVPERRSAPDKTRIGGRGFPRSR
jgi:hypothetical protein